MVEDTSIEATWHRLSGVLRAELAWSPERLFLVGRIVLACTLAMILIMVFRIPGAALGAYYPLLISRETPRSTLRSATVTAAACILGTAEVVVGAMLFSGSPFLHLLWVAASLFTVFYLISSLKRYDAALALGLVITNAIVLWDLPLSAGLRVQQTLFTLLSILLGCAVTVVVEYLFAHTTTPDAVLEGIRLRLTLAGDLLRSYGDGRLNPPGMRAKLVRLATVGTGGLRNRLLDSTYEHTYKEALSAALALSGRLIELTANFAELTPSLSPANGERCSSIAANIAALDAKLSQKKAPDWADLPEDDGSSIPLLVEIERIVDLIAQCFTEDELPSRFRLGDVDQELSSNLFVPDAFISNRHIRFAIRGSLSAMVCYLFYMSAGWTGLGASTATCVLTALPNTGASRHKQLLRFAGMIVGACVLGFGTEVFILPQIDSLGGFALLFALVIAIGAWVGTSGPRIAYAGAQLVLAYDLVNLNRFTISTSLVPARDTVLGILLGIGAMWMIFDHLWPEPSGNLTRSLFLSTIRDIARLDLQPGMPPPVQNLHVIVECDRLNRNFDQLRNLVDFAVFESFPKSRDELFITACVTEMQPQLRSLLLVKAGLLHQRIAGGSADVPALTLRVQECSSAVLLDVVQSVEAHGRQPHLQTDGCAGVHSLLRELIEHARRNADAHVLTELRLCSSLAGIADHVRTAAALRNNSSSTDPMALAE